MSDSLKVYVPVSKNDIRKVSFDTPFPHRVYHIYPYLDKYPARQIPDSNNPRSHDAENLVRSRVSKEIVDTLKNSPTNFKLRNRGGLVIAKHFKFNDEKGEALIELSDYETYVNSEGEEVRPLHGLADGGTTDRIISDMQQSDQYESQLKQAQWHLEVVVFGKEKQDKQSEDLPVDEDVLRKISWSRNTSQQVKGWSFLDLKGNWNWLKQSLDAKYKGLVAYEEYAGGSITVLDILAILNLFHPSYEGGKAPTASYSSKGSMLSRYEKRSKGFKLLTPVLTDLLDLHDYIYSTFAKVYAENGSKKSLRRYAKEGDKVFPELSPEKTLLFSNYQAPLEIHKGLLFPVLASFRALLEYPQTENEATHWFTDPKAFWDEHGSQLITRLIDALIQHKHNPQTCGKDPNLYRNLHDAVLNIRQKEELAQLKEELGIRK